MPAKKKRKSPAWTRKAGKNPKGGLNAKGRASYNKQTGGNLKAPVMPGAEKKDGKPTRLLLSLKAWGASSKADARRKAKAISKRNKAKKKRKK